MKIQNWTFYFDGQSPCRITARTDKSARELEKAATIKTVYDIR